MTPEQEAKERKKFEEWWKSQSENANYDLYEEKWSYSKVRHFY